MEWIREWIVQVAGVIVLSSICEIIMPDGEMKKYVRLIVGLVLVFTVIRPIIGFSESKTEILSIDEKRTQAAEFSNRLSERERFEVIKVYKEKLSQNIKNEIRADRDEVDVKVEVEEDDEDRFGDIISVTVIVYENQADFNDEAIKQTISREFGVKKEAVKVLAVLNKSDGADT